MVHAECYKLPPSAGDISDTSGWELVTPEKHIGFTALSMATGAFSRFTPDYNHSPKYPFRLPGFIQLAPSHYQLASQLVDACNLQKVIIKELINSSKLNQSQKRDLIQSICPNAITLQIYRLIKAADGPVKRVGFTWCNKNSMRTINKDEFLTYLAGSKDNPPSGKTRAEWAPWVDKEIELVKAKPGEFIKIKRPLPITPKLNISFKDDTNTVMFYGHTPTIVFGEQACKVSPLKSYIKAKSTSKTEHYNYLIKRLYVINETC
ncbi:MAG: DNA replication terminus site-binding protein [Pseudoalteromonas sp.]|nr:DNA replication terminus site-binding protein [Pseudoalteromonas sp.]